MRFRGIFFGVVVLAGAAFAPGMATAGAVPTNDARVDYAKIFVPDPDRTGVRRKAERVNGPAIDPEILTSGSVELNDPPLVQPVPPVGLQPFSNCPSRASVLSDPTAADWYAQRTVWYEITRDSTGAPFSQDTLVTIDTGASAFASALEVFAGTAPPGPFIQSAPVLPGGVVACDRNPSGAVVPQVVSFVAQKGLHYFLMAGIAPTVMMSTANLRLSMRILDIQAPAATVQLDETPDVSEVFEYTVSTDDPTSTGSQLEVRQQRAGAKAWALRRLLLGSKCDAAHLRIPARAGTYCMRGSSVFVHWAPVRSTSELGRVLIGYRDRAGNEGRNTLQTQLRDRKAPKITRASARWTKRGRLFVTATCTGGPGKIAVQYGTAKKSAGKPQTFNSTRNTTMRLRQAFPRVTRRTTFLHVVCMDRSKNADDTWLFLPR